MTAAQRRWGSSSARSWAFTAHTVSAGLPRCYMLLAGCAVLNHWRPGAAVLQVQVG